MICRRVLSSGSLLFGRDGAPRRPRYLPWPPYIRPILRLNRQASTHRIVQNVIGLFLKTLFRSESMIEEIALPTNVILRRSVMFPLRRDGLHILVGRESQQSVQMVRHEQNQVCPPFTSPITKLDGGKQFISNLIVTKLVVAFWIAANGNEVNRLFGLNP
jgi:hypothetical protein